MYNPKGIEIEDGYIQYISGQHKYLVPQPCVTYREAMFVLVKHCSCGILFIHCHDIYISKYCKLLIMLTILMY